MKVQIFIPTFNRAAKLERVIRSVLNQTYPNVEVVVLDNHSTDDTPKLLASLMASDSRVKHIRHDKNIGMIANFNAVQGLVDSEYFSMFTDDDEYEPWFVETALKCFEKNKEIQFVVCNAPTKFHGEIIKGQLDHWEEGLYKANTAILKCLSGQYPLVTNCLFKSDIGEDFFFHKEMGNVGDGLLLTCLFAKYDAFVTKTITGYWNNDGENASSVQKYDPVLHINTVINESLLYSQFCKNNNIAMRGFLKIGKNNLIAVLVAADRSNFKHIYKNSMLKEHYGSLSVAMLWLMHKVRFLRICLKIKSLFVSFRAKSIRGNLI
ncbi:MAG: glycosyltransferase family 2 protein [Thermoleophilia bacterium]